jgi:hypothetical protein
VLEDESDVLKDGPPFSPLCLQDTLYTSHISLHSLHYINYGTKRFFFSWTDVGRTFKSFRVKLPREAPRRYMSLCTPGIGSSVPVRYML